MTGKYYTVVVRYIVKPVLRGHLMVNEKVAL